MPVSGDPHIVSHGYGKPLSTVAHVLVESHYGTYVESNANVEAAESRWRRHE